MFYRRTFARILHYLEKLMSKQSDAAAILEGLATKLGDVDTAVKALVAAAANQDKLDPTLQTAIDHVSTATAALAADVAPPAPPPAP